MKRSRHTRVPLSFANAQVRFLNYSRCYVRLATLYVFRMENQKAIQMGDRILRLAEQLDDADMKIEAEVLVGYTLAFRDPQDGGAYLEKAVASYDLERPRAGRQLIGPYPAVVGLAVSAIFLWMVGYPDRAHQRAADSILLAHRLNHPYSITYALFHSGLLNVWMKNYEIARERAQALLESRRSARLSYLDSGWSVSSRHQTRAIWVQQKKVSPSSDRGYMLTRTLRALPSSCLCCFIFVLAHTVLPPSRRLD